MSKKKKSDEKVCVACRSYSASADGKSWGWCIRHSREVNVRHTCDKFKGQFDFINKYYEG